MKKILALLLALVMVVGLVACGDKTEVKDPTTEPTTNNTEATTPSEEDQDPTEGTGEEIGDPTLTVVEYMLLDLYDKTPMEFPVMTWALDLSDLEAFKAFTGLDTADGVVAAAVTEPAMSSQAYSVVVVQLADASKAEDVAKAMEEGINPAKWICVEADDLKTVIVDNYVMLVMMSSDFKETATSETITTAFVEMMKTWEAPEGANETFVPETEENLGDAMGEIADSITDAVENTEGAENTEASEGATDDTNAVG